MGFIKGTMFVVSGGLFRPTSKRERAQRTNSREMRKQTHLMREQNWLMEQEMQALASRSEALASQAEGWADQQSAAPSANAQPTMSKLDKLAALNELHAQGVLTDEEFAEQKAITLGGSTQSAGG